MPTSGGYRDHPRDYTRHTNSRGINPAAITHRGGSFDPKGFAVEPVSCNAKVAGEATTPIAQAISIQTNCVEQHREYLDHIDAQQNPDPRVPVDQRALAQLDAQRKAFDKPGSAIRHRTRTQSSGRTRRPGRGPTGTEHRRIPPRWRQRPRATQYPPMGIGDPATHSQTPGEAVATAARLRTTPRPQSSSVLVEACPPICKARVPNLTGSFRR